MELENSGIYRKFLDFGIAGEKWNASTHVCVAKIP